DRAEPALEHVRTRLEVHLGLPGAGRAVEEVRPAAGDDSLDGGALCVGERGRLVLAAERLALGRRHGTRSRIFSPFLGWCNERERTAGRRAVVVGQPERELDERARNLTDDGLDRAYV